MWRPGDWILHGAYCPQQDIRAALAQIREQQQSPLLLHLAFDEDALLTSLLFVSSAEQDDRRLEEQLKALLSRRSPRDRFFEQVQNVASTSRSSRKRNEALLRIGSQLTDAWSYPPAGRPALLDKGTSTASIKSMLLTFETEVRRLSQAHGRQLATMINATPPAEARRDTMAMIRAARLPRVPPTANTFDNPPPESFIREALKLAIAVTKADAGAIYLRAATRPTVLRIEHAIPAAGGDVRYAPSINLGDAADSDLIQVLDRQRFIHRQSGQTFGAPDALTPAAELLCPLPWTSAVPDGPSAGLIVLHKVRNPGSFSAYDRALVRNVSLRIGMHRYASAAGSLGAAIASMRRGSTNEPQPAAARPMMEVPSDVVTAQTRIAQSLPTLCDATDSHSVSLRLLLPSTQSVASHGLALTRIAAHPADELIAGTRVQEPDSGANWTVVTTGKVVVYGDTEIARNYTALRPTTRSELSVPVRSEGRIVGTLNLESPYLDHYGALAPLVEAFGSAIGRVLADTSTSYARESLSRSLAIDGLSHDLKKYVDEAMAELSNDTLNNPNIRRSLEKAQSTIDSIRMAAEYEYSTDTTFGELVRLSIRDADTPTLLGGLSIPGRLAIVGLSGHQADVLRPVLKQLFVNLKDHGASYLEDRDHVIPSVSASLTTLDGVDHLVTTITNTSAIELNPDLLRDLYRVPVYGTRKRGRRLGAYLAGVRVRSLGGLLAAHAASDALSLQTTLCLPVTVNHE